MAREVSRREENGGDGSRPPARMWAPYSSRRFGGADLYKFAWAQAVQNKPLGLDNMMESKEGCDDDDEVEFEIDDDGGEKEEGEIEEGEIELGSQGNNAAVQEKEIEVTEKELDKVDLEEGVGGKDSGSGEVEGGQEMEDLDLDLDRQVGLILEELEAVTEEEAEKSFEDVCTRLRKSFENLKAMVSEEARAPVVDALVSQAFVGIQTVYSVVCSSTSTNMEQNKDFLLRLLIHIKNQYHVLLTETQLEEMDTMVKSIVFDNRHKDAGKTTNFGETNISSRLSEKQYLSPGMISTERSFGESRPSGARLPKLEVPNVSRIKPEFCPLIDLHAAYDENSLPSPTRDNAPPVPIQRPIGVGLGNPMSNQSTIAKQSGRKDGLGNATSVQPLSLKNTEDDLSSGNITSMQSVISKNTRIEDISLHSYVTDPIKAVSSYQQKYGRKSFFPCDRLPSPTPSEEGSGGDNDVHGEVSSIPDACNSGASGPPTSSQIVGTSSKVPHMNNSSGHQQPPVKTIGTSDSLMNVTTKITAKSRDPRLKFINSDLGLVNNLSKSGTSVAPTIPKDGVGAVMSSKKHKGLDEVALDSHTLKRQRIGTGDRGSFPTTVTGGWLEESSTATHSINDKTKAGEISCTSSDQRIDANTNISILQRSPSTVTPASTLAPAVKDISAVNPTMLIQLIQQRLTPENQQKSVGPPPTSSGSLLTGVISLVPSVPTTSATVVQKQVGSTQTTAQPAIMNPQNDSVKIRMKPRDPRRILHSEIIQKDDLTGSIQATVNGAPSLDLRTKDNLVVGEHGDKAQSAGLPPQSVAQSNITGQFTKHIVNSLSAPPVDFDSSIVPQTNSQPVPSMVNKVEMRPTIYEASNQKFASGPASEAGTCGAMGLPFPWGDVDHLLDGYDHKQKVAIQRERARRIEEQNKMFAARKLCLVLDLDHTLLNSAKFTEVDPVHDEILRKKEELDREKPERHLFRFPHMGMWTKLRPGIWNFLEKASKLYELHVYTMGNKLYATEMAKILDPTGALFAGRVISRGDDGDILDGDDRVPKSKDLDGVLGMESAVVIIDDSMKVWPHHKPNLIVVERYTYFPCSRRQFGLPGPSLLEIDHDERPEDGTLSSSLAVIEKIHQNFFSHRSLNEADVRNILATEQQKILGGCRIVFSRIFPVGEANPHLHPLWQTAEQFGAVCTSHIDEMVTHVVANSFGTDKVNWALSTGRFVVHPSWVEASALLYRRANELDFAIKQ